MKSYKEIRLVLDNETHANFKATACKNEKSMKEVLLKLIDNYIKRGKYG
jgi:hypothetical protein